jgi:hypothetical protein
MASRTKTKAAIEFGDFQTPLGLAGRVCATLLGQGAKPLTIVEPTCGEGNFLIAALDAFRSASRVLGFERNELYVERARSAVEHRGWSQRAQITQADFFATDWASLLADLPEPLLILGNPPWVTNAELGTIGSRNLPAKCNFQNHTGFDAITGKSNFDIAEWMLIKLLDAIESRQATLAMLCKTSVARKVLLHAWKNGMRLSDSAVYRIDAAKSFDAAADACLLVCRFDSRSGLSECPVYAQLGDARSQSVIGYQDARLVADVKAYHRLKHLRGAEAYRWRSGIKHDCGKVMEFVREGARYRNGLGELIDLEETYLYPMLKSSDLASPGVVSVPHRWMLVTQRAIGEETAGIAAIAPKTWRYLLGHAEHLDKRASSIYRKRSRFSVFGVGDYSFAAWKVAISGLYKKLQFRVLGPIRERPVVLDDTCYFVPCQSEEEAGLLFSLLDSETAKEFFNSLIFWDSKRPITADVLRQLDLGRLADELGLRGAIRRFLAERGGSCRRGQLGLFDDQELGAITRNE